MKTKFEVMLQLTSFNSSCGFKKDCNIKHKNVPKNKAKLFEDNIETDHTNLRPEYSEDSSDQTYYVVVSKVVSFSFYSNPKKFSLLYT